MAIGWQLLYEGLWKIDTLNGPSPWTAAGYLKNAQGPLRGVFRDMAGDPDDLGWLDYETTAANWDDWLDRFRTHYQLDEKQLGSLHRLVEGSYSVIKDGKRTREVYAESLDKLPEGVKSLKESARVSDRVVWFDAKAKRIYVDAVEHLKPDELEKLKAVVKGRTDADSKAYLTAVERVYDRQKKGMGFREKLLGALKGDPELVGNDDWQRVGKLQEYRERLVRYENAMAKADQDFEWDHLNHSWDELQTLRAELSGPIKALDTELKEKAQSLLTLNQLAMGPVPGRWSKLEFADQSTIIGLTVFGAMLLLGLGTRIAAVGGAVSVTTKSTHEAYGLPTPEANAEALRTTRMAVYMARHIRLDELPEFKAEADLIRRETRPIIDRVLKMGDGDAALGTVRALEAGALDIPWSPNRYVQSRVMPARDADGYLRIYDPGNLVFEADVADIHSERLKKRAEAEGVAYDHNLAVSSVYEISEPLDRLSPFPWAAE